MIKLINSFIEYRKNLKSIIPYCGNCASLDKENIICSKFNKDLFVKENKIIKFTYCVEQSLKENKVIENIVNSILNIEGNNDKIK